MLPYPAATCFRWSAHRKMLLTMNESLYSGLQNGAGPVVTLKPETILTSRSSSARRVSASWSMTGTEVLPWQQMVSPERMSFIASSALMYLIGYSLSSSTNSCSRSSSAWKSSSVSKRETHTRIPDWPLPVVFRAMALIPQRISLTIKELLSRFP